MSSNWLAEIGAIFQKELRSELRTGTGLLTSGLFSIVAVVAIALAGAGQQINPALGAGMLWVALLFSSILSLPRSFVSEEEAGTADLLRLMARPQAVFWGKALFNLVQMFATAVMLSILFLVFTNLSVANFGLYVLSLLGGSFSLAFAVTLCGALVSQASNRAALAGAIGVPLLLPLIAMGVGAIGVSMGAGTITHGLEHCLGLYSYAVLLGAAAPHLYAAVWKG